MVAKKWKVYDRNRKYNINWEKTFAWVKKAADGSENAYCKLCYCTIVPRMGNIRNHEKTEKHWLRTPSTMYCAVKTENTPTEDQNDDSSCEAICEDHSLSPTCISTQIEDNSRLWFPRDWSMTVGSSNSQLSNPEQFLEIEKEKLKVKKEKLQLLKVLVDIEKEQLALEKQQQ